MDIQKHDYYVPDAYTTAPDEPKRESPIFREYGELSLTIDAIDKEISVLAERLAPVLEPDTPTATSGEKNGVAQSLCPLATNLRAEATRLRYLVSRLTALRIRIEL